MSALLEKLRACSPKNMEDLFDIDSSNWVDYIAKGITSADADELKHIIGSNTEIDIPIHALRALHQVAPSAATAEFLMAILLNIVVRDIEESLEDEDEETRGLVEFFADNTLVMIRNIGEVAIAPMQAFLEQYANSPLGLYPTEALQFIGYKHPELKTECVSILVKKLLDYKTNDPETNAALIFSLMELDAAFPCLKTIRAAYKEKRVSTTTIGELSDVELALGLKSSNVYMGQALSPKEKAKRTAKNKQVKKARKQNRKK
jgi:hypothetical protein